MKTYLISVLAALGMAGTATASFIDPNGLPVLGSHLLQAHSIETGELVYGGGGVAGTPIVTYASGIWPDNNGPFIASFAGSVLRDDYVKDPGANAHLTEFKFVGGVATAGEQIQVLFLDVDENVVSGFSVALPQGGNFIWTITLGDSWSAASAGFVQIQHGDQGNVTWFATSALHVGDNLFIPDGHDGSWETTMYAFSMASIPAPGALALLGIAGLVGARRRRSQ